LLLLCVTGCVLVVVCYWLFVGVAKIGCCTHLQSTNRDLRMLLDMKSTSMAFVVFDSENAKSAAVDAALRQMMICKHVCVYIYMYIIF
jgi:hypothetical protein